MADYAISNVPRRVVYAPSGVGPYAFTFEILDQTDISVYRGSTLLTLTTDYTVTINENGTGSVTLVATAGTSNITIVGAKNIQRTTDFTTGGDLFANTLNDELDNQTIFVQQVAETAERGLKAPVTDPTDINMTLPSRESRAGKILAFDGVGNPVVGEDIGNWRDDWEVDTSYSVRDLVKDPVNANVYRVNTAHTSSGVAPLSTNVQASKYDLVVDAASAAASASASAASATASAASASAASTSATNASNFATNAANSATAAAASAATIDSGNINITGGSVNGAPVGNTTASTGRFSDLTDTGLTAGRVTYAGTGGNLVDSSSLTFNGTSLSVNGMTLGRAGPSTAEGTNSAFGTSALGSITSSGLSGIENTAVGYFAARLSTTGSGNTAVGAWTMQASTTGNNNTAFGSYSLFNNTTGSINTAIGRRSMLANTTGSSNSCLGLESLFSNTVGTFNTAIGNLTCYQNTSGNYNTGIGYAALLNCTTGSGNTAINPTGLFGAYAPVFNPTTQDNRFCMGSTTVTNAYIQVAWTVVSDARDKTDFAKVPHGLDFVSKLKPTAYRYKANRDDLDGHGPVRYGFKAQEVLELEGNAPVIVDAEDPEKLRFNDQSMIAVLVQAIQELKTELNTVKDELNTLKGSA
jgi:hypothetical protein